MKNLAFKMLFSNLFPGRKEKKSTNRFASEFIVEDPSNYDFLWTIKSFSKFIGNDEGRLVSGIFESKGYSWKLVMYPNGNSVNGQISLYFMLTQASSHQVDVVFKVSYELFLFDQNTGGTLSKKGENLGQVHDKIGFRNMIDLKTFKDSSNGYLMKDSCMFGVKIFQCVLIQTPTECMYLMEKVSHEYSWKIETFSKLDKKSSHVKKFTAGDYLWSISFHPESVQKSDNKVKGNYVTSHLFYHGSIHDTSAMKVYAKFTLSILDQIEGNHKKKTDTVVFKCGGSGWGGNLISLEEFNDPTLGIIVNDTCIIEVEVIVHALVE
ncbi:hypothetical protein KSP39_PZI006776 [Platanthera zijinensis]|uniref:MATH domain-containing protein n=1 Tax=Platanthera zijinensis TaxID=2320716 RepID=A0AAP0BPQ0_9ASPA